MDKNHGKKAELPWLYRLYPWRKLRTGIALTFAVSTFLLSVLLNGIGISKMPLRSFPHTTFLPRRHGTWSRCYNAPIPTIHGLD
jgi:hypothetical protein